MTSYSVCFGDNRYKVPDLVAAKKFYSNAFDVLPYFDEPTWVIFQISDYHLWLEPDDLTGESIYETSSRFYDLSSPDKFIFWMVEDIQKVYDRFIQLGGTIFQKLKPDGPFSSAIVMDPWNNKVGLHSRLT